MTIAFSNELSKSFNQENLMSLIIGSLVLLGICVRWLNLFFLLNFKHRNKNIICLTFFILALMLMIGSKYLNQFIYSIIGIMILGIGTSLGDSINLGFLEIISTINIK